MSSHLPEPIYSPSTTITPHLACFFLPISPAKPTTMTYLHLVIYSAISARPPTRPNNPYLLPLLLQPYLHYQNHLLNHQPHYPQPQRSFHSNSPDSANPYDRGERDERPLLNGDKCKFSDKKETGRGPPTRSCWHRREGSLQQKRVSNREKGQREES